MKINRIVGIFIILVGALLIFGSQFLFPACNNHEKVMACHWTSKAEIGIGITLRGL